MNALVVYQEAEWRDLLSFYLEGHFNLDPLGVADVDEAILILLKYSNEIQTVICGPYLDTERLLWSILAEKYRLDLILNSDPDLKLRFPFRGKNWIHFVPSFDLISSLDLIMGTGIGTLSESKSALQIARDVAHEVTGSNGKGASLRIKPRLLLHCSPLVTKVFIRRNLPSARPELWKDEGSIIQPEDLSQLTDLQATEDLQVGGLYIEEQKCSSFALRIQENLLNRQKNAKIQIPAAGLSADALRESRLEYLKKRLSLLEQETQHFRLTSPDLEKS